MPTTTRLVAALLMAVLGWAAAMLALRYLPQGQTEMKVAAYSAGIGALVGWFWTGARVESGRQSAVGAGFVGSVILVLWDLIAFAGNQMLERAVKVQYDGPVDAIQGWISLALENARDMAKVDVLLLLAVGGVLIGGLSGWVSRRFR